MPCDVDFLLHGTFILTAPLSKHRASTGGQLQQR
jgi:hypothetical protein